MILAPRRSFSARGAACVVAALAIIAVLLPTCAHSRPLVTVKRDITYDVTSSGYGLTLDRWRPVARSASPRPVVVLVHGGGWRSGDKREWEQAAWPATLAARGMVVFNVNYRLACPAPADRFKPSTAALCGFGMRESRRDVRAAVRWAARHARANGGDPTRITLVGGSAGAQLALLAGSDPTLPRVRAVVAISPPAHLPWFARTPAPRLQNAISTAIGCRFRACPDDWRSFSPSTHVRAGRTPRTYLFVSGADSATPLAQAHVYERLLRRAGIPHVWRTTRQPSERCHGTRLCMRTQLRDTPLKLRADVFAFLASLR